MRKKRVLLLSEGFGSGHTQAAYALAAGMKHLSPEIQTRVLELGKFLNPVLVPLIMTAYRKTLGKQPRLVGMMYRTNYKRSFNRFTQLALHRIFYKQTEQVIKQLKPDLIVCTHPGPNAVVARLKRLGLDIPLYTLITDYDAHGTWVNREVSRYLVSTLVVKDKLISRGIASERIEVTGIPVHPQFWETQSREEVQRELGIRTMPTVLVMGGGWGLLEEEDEFITHMARWRENVQLIICTGKNVKSREALLDNPLFVHPNIHVLGFTKEVSKLMDASDLLVTKPGGMTCTEGMSKGIPMLFYKPLPGQEEENLDFFVTRGFGEAIQSTMTIDRWFQLIQLPCEAEQFRLALISKRNQQYNPLQCPAAVLRLMQ